MRHCTFVYPAWVAQWEQSLTELEGHLHYLNGLIVGSSARSVDALARICDERRHLAKSLESWRLYLVEHRVPEKIVFSP